MNPHPVSPRTARNNRFMTNAFVPDQFVTIAFVRNGFVPDCFVTNMFVRNGFVGFGS